jgi:radical SAM family RiPP maturation amino acid epimerase
VGCWFCGISAEKKKSDFLYTESNAALWRAVLAVLHSRVGDAAGSGFLYWASDPMDNPDYEKLAMDFARICGRFPQTTTAISHKDIERTRALLRQSAAHGSTINRFSVLSLGQFRKIMEAFTPEELLHCEIVGQHAEAAAIQSNAGRARNSPRLRQRAEAKGQSAAQWAENPGTIACVSGWLVNMPRRRVRLITPCPASDRWPDGYWTLEEGHFETAADLEALLDGMTRRHMKASVRASDIPRFRADLEFEASDGGFVLRATGCVASFKGVGQTLFGKAIAEGRRTAGEIALQMEREFEAPMEDTFNNLNGLFDGGYLDEEPAFTPTVSAS